MAHDPTCGTGREYFGIPFQLDYVLRVQKQAGHAGVVDAWELGWPQLRDEDRIADVMWTAASAPTIP